MNRYMLENLTESSETWASATAVGNGKKALANIILGNITGTDAKCDIRISDSQGTPVITKLVDDVPISVDSPATELKGIPLVAGEKIEILPHTEDISVIVVGFEEEV